jgi:c-di-GMP-binding flagellar brake protein YcgR
VSEPRIPQQRRATVRAHVRVPVTLTIGGERLRGNTLDLSEGGAACAVTAGVTGPPPKPGTPLEAALVLDAERVWLPGMVLSSVLRRGWWIVTVRFANVPERDQDRVREHVFTALRRERSRGFR